MTATLSTTRRVLASLILAVHVTAVFVGPWSLRPYDSPLSGTIASAMEPYLRALSLDNGYRFFAPEPGPSHLIRYVLTLPDGRTVGGVFPDLKRHRPRLLYHRHFMLTEFLNALDSPAYQDPTLDQATIPDSLRPLWQDREMFRALVRSYARHLAVEHGARRVELYLRRHEIPAPEEVLGGTRLDDPRLYREKLLGVFEGEELT